MTSNCKVCGSSALYEILDMGEMPLAGDFRPLGERNQLFSLAIDGCESCGVLQIREIVDQSLLFGPTYCYASSTVPGLVRHFDAYARFFSSRYGSGCKKRVFEVGCNDGVFLSPLSKLGFEVVGIDASDNVATMARKKGLDVHTGFLGMNKAQQLANQYGKFDIVTCSNVFAHNPNVNDFIEAVDCLLDEKGEFWIEVHSAHHLFDGLQWDCFYHEHCYYWTLQALERCLGTYDFRLKHYETTPMHGGALRAAFCKSGQSVPIVEQSLSPDDWRKFGENCLRSREVIRECIHHLPINYAYGAAGRAVMLINWAQIADSLEFVVDGSPLRFNKAIPNTSVPIISEEEFFSLTKVNDWCFVSAHNYLEGIRGKVDAAFPDKKMKYVVPLPYVTIK